MHRYSSGDWYTLVTADGLAMLPDSVSRESVERVWLALAEGRGLAAVLEGIVGTFGASLSSIPPFAVASRTAEGAGVQVAVRGPIGVMVRAAGQETSVTGLGVTTWSERSIDEVEAVEAALPGAAAASLPINDGVVLANRIRFAFRESQGKGIRLNRREPDEVRIEAPEVPEMREVPEEPEVPEVPEVPGVSEVTGVPELPGVSEVTDTSVVAAAPESPEPSATEHKKGPVLGVPPSGETTIGPLPGDLLYSEVDGYDDDYDRLLYGDTVMSTVEDAAVRVSDEVEPSEPAQGTHPIISGLPRFAPPGAAFAASEEGDHDGETISLAKLRAMQAQVTAPPVSTSIPVTRPAQRPAITLVVSTGERIALDRGAVVGRRPRLARVQGGNVPQLVTVPSPNQDVSRSHVELRVEGTHLLAVDLDTTNGTKLLRPGLDPVRLQPGEATMLVDGDRLDLGDGILLEFEGLR